ncbi:MAG: hypothetical protein LBS85_00315 [Clostridiales Family XIII bacterium]|jgi:hypothetical protein|nr:hypothetical protein [Clostridiales Family XIII bacterium]
MSTKIQTASKRIVTLLTVLKILCFIAMVIEVIGLLWPLLPAADNFLSIGGAPILEYSLKILSPSADLSSPLPENLTIQLLMVLIQQAFILRALFMAGFIFKTIQLSHSPFVPVISRKMKHISIVLIFAAMFSAGFLMTIIIAGICFCFAVIFDYGCELQRKDDETL